MSVNEMKWCGMCLPKEKNVISFGIQEYGINLINILPSHIYNIIRAEQFRKRKRNEKSNKK